MSRWSRAEADLPSCSTDVLVGGLHGVCVAAEETLADWMGERGPLAADGAEDDWTRFQTKFDRLRAELTGRTLRGDQPARVHASLERMASAVAAHKRWKTGEAMGFEVFTVVRGRGRQEAGAYTMRTNGDVRLSLADLKRAGIDKQAVLLIDRVERKIGIRSPRGSAEPVVKVIHNPAQTFAKINVRALLGVLATEPKDVLGERPIEFEEQHRTLVLAF